MRSGRTKKTQVGPVLNEKVSFLEFIEVYNLHVGFITPRHHKEMARWLVDTDDHSQRLLMAWRGSGKSWLICAYIVWCLYMDPMWTCIIISASQTLSSQNSGFIRGIIHEHPLAKHLEPSDKTLWQVEKFEVVRPFPGRPSVLALTLGGDITGMRADAIFADDCETKRNGETGEEQTRTRKRLKELFSISRHITWTGTPQWGRSTIYGPMLKDPIRFAPLRIPVYTLPEGIEDTQENKPQRTYMWPEEPHGKFDEKGIDELIADIDDDAEFRSQFLLEEVDLAAAGFKMEWITEYDMPLQRNITRAWHQTEDTVNATIGTFEIIDLCCGWDPAGGDKKDASVATIAGRSRDNRLFIHAQKELSSTGGAGWGKQADEVIAFMIAYGCRKVVVETNLNEQFPHELRESAKRARQINIRVNGVRSIEVKEKRISRSLENEITNGRLHVSKEVLSGKWAEQARTFPTCVKNRNVQDDHLDSSSMAVTGLQKLPPGMVVDGGLYSALRQDGGIYMQPGQARGGSVLDRFKNRVRA